MGLLIIEDNEDDYRILEGWLRNNGNQDVTWCKNLKDGLDRLRQTKFDAVLLDLNLPDSQGLSTLEQLLAQSPDAAVIVVTGQEGLATESLMKGAHDYLVKDNIDKFYIEKSIEFVTRREDIRQGIFGDKV